MYNMSC